MSESPTLLPDDILKDIKNGKRDLLICKDSFRDWSDVIKFLEALVNTCITLRLHISCLVEPDMFTYEGQDIQNYRRNKVILIFKDIP